jgi:hypothetical protein
MPRTNPTVPRGSATHALPSEPPVNQFGARYRTTECPKGEGFGTPPLCSRAPTWMPYSPVGLIVPWALGIAPILTPIAAACLALLMIGAVRAHVLRNEPTIPPIVLGALSAFVAIGRFMQL